MEIYRTIDLCSQSQGPGVERQLLLATPVSWLRDKSLSLLTGSIGQTASLPKPMLAIKAPLNLETFAIHQDTSPAALRTFSLPVATLLHAAPPECPRPRPKAAKNFDAATKTTGHRLL